MLNNTIGVAGDWHGDLGWALRTLDVFAELGIEHVHQLGDFGLWHGNSGRKFLYRIQKRLEENSQVLDVTLGNHENYSLLHSHAPTVEGVYQFGDRINLLPRVWRGNYFGRAVASLGGAASIDFDFRTPNIDWWAEEAITLGDIYKFREGGKSNIMFAHERPTGVGVNSSSGWGVAGLKYADESSDMMRQAVNVAKPKIFFHGHYHTHYVEDVMLNDGIDDYVTRFIGLDMNGAKFGANALFNVDTLEFEIL